MTSARAPDPRNDVIRSLLVRSGNRCAFPGCDHPIVNEHNRFVAQVCHIESAAPGGPRYNPAMTDEERRGFANLVLLCYRHHIETNDIVAYPPAGLRGMKRAHEASMAGRPFAASESAVAAVALDANAYWARVDIANRFEHAVPSLRVPVDIAATPAELFDGCRQALERLASLHGLLNASAEALSAEVDFALRRCGYDLAAWQAIPYYENPTIGRDWEVRSFGLSNALTDLHMLLDQVEIRHLETTKALGGHDSAAASRLESLRAKLLNAARSAGYSD